MDKIGVLCYYSFPEGMAPTNRIIAYCKGLNAQNVATEVIIFKPKVGLNSLSQGNIGEIKYVYAHKRKENIGKIHIIIEWMVALFKSLKIIMKSHKSKPFDTILFSFDFPLYLIFFGFFIKLLLKIKIGFIADEYPYEIRTRGKNKISLTNKYLFKLAFFFVSYRILIHDKLRDYYNKEIGYKDSYVMGSIIDEERFNIEQEFNNFENNLCYFGGMDLNNDNVDLIIYAFNQIKDKYPNVNLLLYGEPSVLNKKIIQSIISELKLENRVFLKGRASYNEVPLLMKRAAVLVTSQSKTKRAEGGLPTKLAEYLISGKPAIVSKVSIIPEILIDRENVYMVEPDNNEDYVKTIDEVLSNYDKAMRVAQRGQIFALNNFGNVHVCQQLYKFLTSINN